MAAPLDGIRVLDLSRVLAGPYCATLLSHLGAEVIKVESQHGDEARTWPPFMSAGEGAGQQEMSAAFLGMNLNKRSIALDLKEARGLDVVERLIREADVLVENFKTGGMEDFGLGWEQLQALNPRLIHVAISAFGRSGPRAAAPGYEALVQAYAGAMDITGYAEGQPARCGVSFLDMSTGVMSAFAAMTALFERQRTGRGRRVDASLLQTAMGLMTMQVANFMQCQVLQQRLGTAHQSIVPYQSYPTADGQIFIASANQRLWERLCRVLGLEALLDDARFADNASRVANRQACLEQVRAAIALCQTEELLDALAAVGVPASRVNTLHDVVEDGQAQAIGAIAPLQDAQWGAMQVSNLPFLLDQQAVPVRARAPLLGEHSAEILAELNYSPGEAAQLFEAGVVF